jgi:hypothetical protein
MVSGRIPISRLNCLIVFLCFLGGCAGLGKTKPNEPYKGPYPSGFNELSAKNPLLAKELGKLPEIQDGVSEIDAMALERLCLFYNQNQRDFDLALDRMYGAGYPNVRKYCSPLQALYWLTLDDELSQIDISNFDLTALLNEAWYKSGFDYDGTTDRWDDFKEVTERLNSPELINYYEPRNFSYKKVRLGSAEDYKNPRYIFSEKVGECWLYTAFSVYCLKKAGYKAHAITVYFNESRSRVHVACAFIDKDGKEYILDNSLSVYVRSTGIYPKNEYLAIHPYCAKGYLSN